MSTSPSASGAPTSIFDFVVHDAKRQPFNLNNFKGKAVLVMNVASKCGFTKSGYEAAQQLYSKFKDTGKFEVLAFPCNQFARQEPGSEEEIEKFACSVFKVNFPIMAKVDVNGENQAPLYSYLKKTVPGILGTEGIKWNFTSFLCDTNGVPIKRYSPGTGAPTIEKDIARIVGQDGTS